MKIKSHKKLLLIFIAIIVMSCYLYQVSRPTIIFHTYQESGFLGKVSTFDGCIDYLYIDNHIAKYRLPHIWNWKEDDEIAIFTHNYDDLFEKKDVIFLRLDIYLDKNGYYKKHTQKNYFWKNW